MCPINICISKYSYTTITKSIDFTGLYVENLEYICNFQIVKYFLTWKISCIDWNTS